MVANRHRKLRHSELELAILGGGQLARMLALAAAPLGLKVTVVSSSQNDPAAQVAPNYISDAGLFKASSRASLYSALKKFDFITFESEFVPADFLSALPQTLRGRFFPDPSVMLMLQNRSTQKDLLLRYDLPTAPFETVTTYPDLVEIWEKWKAPFVLKKAWGGYDGFGTFYVKKKSDLTKHKKLFPEVFIAEPFVHFRRELAAVFFRNLQSEVICLPLVESHQKDSRCDWVKGPIPHPHWTTLQRQIANFMDQENYIGALAFEFFELENRNLVINEVAPRVHNSGHYSQDALNWDQFQLHLLSAVSETFPPLQMMAPAFAMTNLVGQSQKEIQIPKSLTGHLHWYGKKENRPGRKMGHVNYLGMKPEDVLKFGLLERKKFRL